MGAVLSRFQEADVAGRTGEFCGSAFFVQLNTKFHALQPDNETFAAEIEREFTMVSTLCHP